MKTKYVLGLFLVLFTVLPSTSFSSFVCFDRDKFCQYQGYLRSLDRLDEEFPMLLEPTYHPNFSWVSHYVEDFFSCAREHPEMLTDPECKVSEYAKKLLIFFRENKANIKHRKLAEEFELFDKEVGRNLLQSDTDKLLEDQ